MQHVALGVAVMVVAHALPARGFGRADTSHQVGLVTAADAASEVREAGTDDGATGSGQAASTAGAVLAADGDSDFSPPQALTDTSVPFPPEADGLTDARSVTVRLLIDPQGAVAEVELLAGAGSPFDEAVLAAVRTFAFTPARYKGQPVAVAITFTQHFAPAVAPESSEAPADAASEWLPCELAGQIVEKGTRRALSGVWLSASLGGAEGAGDAATERLWQAESADGGSFSLRLPPGRFRVRLAAAGYKAFAVTEVLRPRQRLLVRYLLERLSYDPYETVVVAQRQRTEIARTTLRDRELHHVPGTFGDPVRVITTLPGVGQTMSLLAYPLVRGTSPGATGMLLDGIVVPQLFHMLAGPSVVHPDLIDRIDFYPGSFPVEYGGYTGGIIDARTRRARPDERVVDLFFDLVRSGVFVRQPIEAAGGTLTAGGTLGYPSLLLRLIPERAAGGRAIFDYGDYLLRFDRGPPDDDWTVFFFGARDKVGFVDYYTGFENSLSSQFHRAELRWQSQRGRDLDHLELILGADRISSIGEDIDLGGTTTWILEPRCRFERALSPRWRLRWGGETIGRWFVGTVRLDDGVMGGVSAALYAAGAWADALWQPHPDWLVIPGLRADLYHNSAATKANADPRLLARHRLRRLAAGDLWLKAGLGWYHQPPRFVIPVPGFEELALEQGLLGAVQSSAGVEWPLTDMLEADLQAYFSYQDPILFDLAVNPVPGPDGQIQFLQKRIGRAFGLELLVKHKPVGPLFGWLSYTLSRSERRHAGAWVPFDWDRTHMLHLVGGLALPRNWELGARVQLQSGRPVTADNGYNGQRVGWYGRLDLRIDKRAVYNEWLLDFYVDIINVTVAAEPLDRGFSLPGFPIPTIGFRAVL